MGRPPGIRLPFRSFLWMPLLLCPVLLSGCWDRVEVSELAIMVGLGIDQAPDGVEVTAQVIHVASQAGQGGGNSQGGTSQGIQQPYLNFQERGATLQEAMHRFYRSFPRRLFVAHNTVVVFGRKYAEQGFDRALDYLERERSFRRSQMFVVTSGSARDLLSARTGLERLTARGIRELIDQQRDTSMTETSIELRVIDQLLSPSGTVAMSWVDPDGNRARVKGVGLFRGGRLVDLVPLREARGLMWLLGRAGRAQIDLPCNGPSSKGQKITVRLLATRVDIDPVPGPDGPLFRVRLQGDGEVEALCPGETPSPEAFRRWGELAAREIRKEMEQAMERLKEKRVDAVQFGTRIFRKDPAWWRTIARRWPDLFPACRVEYDIDIHLLRSGMISHSPQTDYTPENHPPRRGQSPP
ncbi:MAG: Ger(x)C family spore germination protein [Alicyclobacillaceae bacterium]|nr:Ger(x)C family spore germination protein [Alicyclobacillaceae bacterium]